MDEEFQKHAFEAFERERTSTESKTEGTGLGLAIVKKLVELMGGQVSIQSKVGQGTKITVCLRLKIGGTGRYYREAKRTGNCRKCGTGGSAYPFDRRQ
ncbi:MAG: sensor histidine kinase [Eubacterium ramulus]